MTRRYTWVLNPVRGQFWAIDNVPGRAVFAAAIVLAQWAVFS